MKKMLIIFLFPLVLTAQNSVEKHVYAGMAVSVVSATITNHYIHKPFVSSLIGVVCGSFVGYAKERIYDKEMGKGVYDVNDMYSTSWGGLVGGFTVLIAFNMQRRCLDSKADYYRNVDR